MRDNVVGMILGKACGSCRRDITGKTDTGKIDLGQHKHALHNDDDCLYFTDGL